MVYIPVYDQMKRQVWMEDEALLRRLTPNSVAKYKENVGFYGTIYNANNIFTSEEAAFNWWNDGTKKQADLWTPSGAEGSYHK